MADISITGDAKYEYDLTDNNGAKSTTANTEAHINFTGKSGALHHETTLQQLCWQSKK